MAELSTHFFYSCEAVTTSLGDTVQTFFPTRREAESYSREAVEANPAGSVSIRKHTVRMPNTLKRAWVHGFLMGRNESNILNIGHDSPEHVASYTALTGWLIKDDRSSTRRLDRAADKTQPF